MTAPNLRNALAAIRRLSPPVATTEMMSGDSADAGKTQAPQGFDESVSTVATVSTDFCSTPHFPPVAPERAAPAPVTSHSVATGGDSGDSQQRRGIPLSPLRKGGVATVATAPHWTADREWCARIGAAGLVPARRVVLREWVDSVPGGWSDAVSIHLPASMPRGLAQANIRTHARCLGLTVCDDPDDPEVMTWLRGAPP